jgi:hypothetical protein
MMRRRAVRILRLALLLAVGVLLTSVTVAQQPDAAPARVSLHFERPGLPVPRFTLVVNEDGSGSYEAEQVFQPQGTREVSAASSQHIERAVMISKPTALKVFELARALDRFHIVCESTAKNIADTGAKTFSYTGAEGGGSCVFNYSENKSVTALADIFQGIAYTLDLGRKLDFDHRFDRLGLDADMTNLVDASADGRALELGTIAHTLHSLSVDPDVLARVRLRAGTLLERFPAAN